MKLQLAMTVGLICFLLSPTAAGQAAVADAQKSAETWPSLADAMNYEGSWDAAAAYFKNRVSQEDWENAMRGVRSPLGSLESRTFKNAMRSTHLPGAPDGDYVVMQFDTSFERKKDGVETVTAVQETDGIWRIVGYFIR